MKRSSFFMHVFPCISTGRGILGKVPWVAVLFFCSFCWARTSERVEFPVNESTVVERQFFGELDSGRLKSFSEADAFLVASGITGSGAFASYRYRFDAIRRQASAAVKGERDVAVRGRKLLTWLHAHVFKKYCSDASTVDRILDRGEFNCLASSVFYAVLARDLRIPVTGLLVPDHALCVVMTASGPVDVETGVRSGFNISEEGKSELNKITGFEYARFGSRRAVSVLQLIGEVYANRAVQLASSSRNDTQLLALYKKAFYFNPSSLFFARNIAACLNNRIVDSFNSKNYAAAEEYIRQGRRFDPQDENFISQQIYWYSVMANNEVAAGRYQEGIDRTKKALRTYPGAIRLHQSLAHLYVSWAHVFSTQENYDAALNILTAGRNDIPNDTTISYNLRTAFYNKAVQCYNTDNFKDAIIVCDQALLFFPGDAEIVRLRQSAGNGKKQ